MATLDTCHFAVELEFGLASCEQVGDFFGRLKTLGRVFFQQSIDDRAEPVRCSGDHVLNRARCVFADSL